MSAGIQSKFQSYSDSTLYYIVILMFINKDQKVILVTSYNIDIIYGGVDSPEEKIRTSSKYG